MATNEEWKNWTENDYEEKIDAMKMPAAMKLCRKLRLTVTDRVQGAFQLALKEHFSSILVQHCDDTGLLTCMDVFNHLKTEDEIRRGKLNCIFTSVISFLNDKLQKQKKIHDQLLIYLPDYLKNLEDHSAKLSRDCINILVAGETSAGKSSLINLLLGQKGYLPTSHVPCTSVICELVYGRIKKAEVYHPQNGMRIIVDGENYDKEIQEIVKKRDEREKPSQYDKVKFFLPIKNLEHVTILDSPGIGENDYLNGLVHKQLLKADAFLYVIMSDNAGGVQEDKLVALLKCLTSLPDKKDLREMNTFSPQSAIFVCNRWDQVKVDERNDVRQDIYKKLKKYWMNFSREQVFYMSCTEAQHMADRNTTLSSNVKFIDGLRNLIPISMQCKLKNSCWILNETLKKLQHILNTRISHATQNAVDRKNSMDDTDERLKKLSDDADTIIRKLQNTLQEKCQECVMKLKAHLRGVEIIADILALKPGLLPPPQCEAKDIEQWVQVQIMEKIMAIIRTWETERGMMKATTRELFHEFTKEFHGIETKLENEKTLMEEFKIADNTPVAFIEVPETESYSATFKVYKDFLRPQNDILKYALVPLWWPAAAAATTFNMMCLRVKHILLEDSNVENFRNYPAEIYRKYAENYLSHFRKRRNLKLFVEGQLQTAQDILDQFQKVVPQQIVAEQNFSKDLQKGFDKKLNCIEAWDDMLTQVKSHITSLNTFSIIEMETYRYEHHVKLKNSRRICGGVIYHIDSAMVESDGSCIEISVKTYSDHLQSTNIRKHISAEVELLSQKNPHNVAAFLGTVKISGNFGIAFKEIRLSFRQYITENYGQTPVYKEHDNAESAHKLRSLTELMKELLTTLQYLHHHKIFHPDLSLDTVAIDTHRNPPRPILTNITSQPTVIHPPSHSHPSQISHLPLEVLRGASYTQQADVYCFGVMLLETLQNSRPRVPDTVPALVQWLANGAFFNPPFVSNFFEKLSSIPDQPMILQEWKKVIADFCVVDPSKRPPISKFKPDILTFSRCVFYFPNPDLMCDSSTL